MLPDITQITLNERNEIEISTLNFNSAIHKLLFTTGITPLRSLEPTGPFFRIDSKHIDTTRGGVVDIVIINKRSLTALCSKKITLGFEEN